MSYIGREPSIGNYQVCDALTASATATYALAVGGTSVSPESANHVICSLNGIIQKPVSSFTISGSNIIFDSALTSSDSIDFILLLGSTLDVGIPSDGTVTNAKLAQDIISGETALAVAPADTDEFLVSDAGTLKRIDYSLIQPGLVKLSTATASTSANLSFNLDTTNYDSFLLTGHKIRPATDGAEAYLYFSEDSGSSYLTTDFYSGRTYVQLTGSSGGGEEQNTIAGAVQLGTDLGNDGDGACQIWMYGMANAHSGANKFGNATYTAKHNTNDYTWDTGFIVIGNNAVNNVKFQMSTGTISTGVLTLYGLRK